MFILTIDNKEYYYSNNCFKDVNTNTDVISLDYYDSRLNHKYLSNCNVTHVQKLSYSSAIDMIMNSNNSELIYNIREYLFTEHKRDTVSLIESLKYLRDNLQSSINMHNVKRLLQRLL